MSETVISVRNLNKRYQIGHRVPYHTLTDSIAKKVRLIGYGFKSRNNPSEGVGFGADSFLALNDVSFDVEKGEILGIIGRNGAGKSTLLKILSRITYPSSGIAEIHGRIGSLLEVGTGFHPELTGRENIFLSGSILGMKKQEINDKFDEIVRFSGIETFLDTPVKRYSSGMYVRLAFAVAAHLEPEILVIDEVLAVGDAEFQKKCLGKMSEIGHEGRTVLFVSHNMNAIEELCNSCIWLETGSIKKNSPEVREVINDYLFGSDPTEKTTLWVNTRDEFSNPWFFPKRAYISDKNNDILSKAVNNNDDFYFTVEGEVTQFDPGLQIGYAIFAENGELLYWSCHTDAPEKEWVHLSRGINVLRSRIPKRLFNQGTYRIELYITRYGQRGICEPTTNAPSLFFTIQGGLSDSPYWVHRRNGLLAPVIPWELIK